ncbi:alpha-amylase family glycosyl hydrolase [Nonomuraea indica]|uniref:alpha-amylase family glycosyl hydrolase n=1 Tax=Nonomuraea indica TaxID=1581193 RepID=UPI001C5E9C63
MDLRPATGQYYLHLFRPEQPALNRRNPALTAEIHAAIECWPARGLDGFRIDTAAYLVKDEDLRDNPQVRPARADAGDDAGVAASGPPPRHPPARRARPAREVAPPRRPPCSRAGDAWRAAHRRSSRTEGRRCPTR